ncbi:hypothetical protein PCASD_00150 [Puccinia coronata f. sp. avenae]|uniref:Uncharacterized protein n=1 Tax=Puccinia coronata f. sp. avenae TaxID=200324 RepID=A0A2N5VQX7_9BASI|nr:hypothetical protein PCASD_00150 [Puccinia coronata f. sp. avenae]
MVGQPPGHHSWDSGPTVSLGPTSEDSGGNAWSSRRWLTRGTNLYPTSSRTDPGASLLLANPTRCHCLTKPLPGRPRGTISVGEEAALRGPYDRRIWVHYQEPRVTKPLISSRGISERWFAGSDCLSISLQEGKHEYRELQAAIAS